LEGDGVAIAPIVYFDTRRRPYLIQRPMLYSNTPGDFDFKLSQMARPLAAADLAAALAGCDLAFPVMHGAFGEDGEVQGLLEGMGVAYVGSGSAACRVAYDKSLAHQALAAAGFATVPSLLYTREGPPGGLGAAEDRARVAASATRVAKPAAGGSSL